MARLVKLDRDCEAGCGRVQTMMLLDVHGHPKGRFCQRCGDTQLAGLQADEDRRYGPLPAEPPEFAEGRLL